MIYELSDEYLFVGLTGCDMLNKELKHVNETLEKNPRHHVIMDLSRITMLTSSHISNLILLHNLLEQNGRRLVLCQVSFQVKCEFTVCGLRDIFHFAEDKYEALDKLSQKV
jgi:anti-anti-sigma factor